MGQIIPLLLGGLFLFLYAIARLSKTLGKIFTDKARAVIDRYTSNIFYAVAIGTTMTILLGSSSAVIILAIVFINSKSLSFKQALGIILGANIGTTFSSQLIAMRIGPYSVIPLVIGIIIRLYGRTEKTRQYGQALLFLGMLFFGLFVMEQAVYPLRNNIIFKQWMESISSDPLKGSLIGGLVTVILQSSSATVGMTIVLGKQQLISIAAGIAIMLGAELGTCADTLLATIKGSRQAVKAGLFHFIFNLSTIIAGLIIFPYFVDLVSYLSGGSGIGRHIANAHMLFNVIGVLLFLPWVGVFEKLLNNLLPDKN